MTLRPGHSRYTASVRTIWPALETFRRENLPVESLLAPFGLSERDVEDDERRIPQDVLTDLWDLATSLSEDPSFGLRALSSLSAKRRGLAEYLLFNSPTLGAMVERGIRYERLWQEGREASLELSGDRAILRWTARPGLRFSASLSEFGVAMVVLMARAATGHELRGEVHFRHPAPVDLTRYEALFTGEVRFSAGVQALVFERELLSAPVRKADPALLSVLEAHARVVLDQIPPTRSIAQSVSKALSTGFVDADVSLERIAAKLQTSSRTLRRQLAAEGVTYRALVDELRRELAFRYLGDRRVSLTEIAFLLGFADAAAFSKAFRRWTGQNASALRKRALEESPREPLSANDKLRVP